MTKPVGRESHRAGQRRARAWDFAAASGVTLDDAASGAWFDTYFTRYRDRWRLHDDAVPCLDALTHRFAGARFALITNGDPAFQSAKVEHVALDARIDHLIASGEVGVATPDPRIFERACAVFDVAPRDAAYAETACTPTRWARHPPA